MPIKTIDVPTLKRWLDNQEAILIDVREPAEHDDKRIAGAILIPLATLAKNKLPPLEGHKLVLHCHLGRRSLSACNKLIIEEPSLDIYNLEGGIDAWGQQGYPVDSNNR